MKEEGVGVILPEEKAKPRSSEIKSGGTYDVIIVGGGAAGLTAGVYASRKSLKTLLISKDVGGQMLLTSEVENYMGFYYIEATDLVRKFEEQLGRYPIDVDIGQTVEKIESISTGFRVITEEGKVFTSTTAIVATGKRSRELNVPGEQELVGRGVSYCATCDAPFFAEKDVAVIGGGNSGFTAVNDLLKLRCPTIHVIDVADTFRADPVLQKKADVPGKLERHPGHEVLEIGGVGGRVANITIRDRKTGEKKILEVEGVFIEIGLSPNSEPAEGLVEMNKWKEIITDCYARTSAPGLLAAGDVTTVPEKQIVVATGEGCKAALAAYSYLLHR